MVIADYELGKKIHELLIKRNIENKVNFNKISQWADEKYLRVLQAKLADFMAEIGLHTTALTAQENAKRIVNFFIEERFWGLNYQNFPRVSLINNDFTYTNPLIAQNIPLKTTCEHHLVPINGNALIAYLPQKHIIGLNKLNQVLDFFANRPQLQERLTKQIFTALSEILHTLDIAVVINARHECMAVDGIKHNQTIHTTSEIGGIFAIDQALNTQILNFSGKLD